MFNNGLPSAVVVLMLFYPFFITVDVLLIFTALDSFSIFGFSAFIFNRAVFACPGGVSFKMIGPGFVPCAGGGQFVALGTYIIIALFNVVEVLNVIIRIRSLGSHPWNGYHYFNA